MLKAAWLCVLIVVASVLPSLTARAQFNGPAFDPDVYVPEIGVPGVFDTLHIAASRDLGAPVNTGVAPGGTYGRIMMKGLTKDSSSSFLEMGPSTDLAHLNIVGNFGGAFPDRIQHIGHIHTATSNDIVTEHGVIYWQKEDGTYDMALSTSLGVEYRGKKSAIFAQGEFTYAELSSDSVEDFVGMRYYTQAFGKFDSIILVYYRGGSNLYNVRGVAVPDSIQLFYAKPYTVEVQSYTRSFTSGAWRGMGHRDIIGISDPQEQAQRAFFLYKNDGHFSMDGFLHSMFNDTVFTAWQNPSWNGASIFALDKYSAAVLPKKPGDRSVDFLPSIPMDGDSNGSIFIFRGGSEFGSHRFYMHTADAVIPNPRVLDSYMSERGFVGFSENITLVGDMTGTGRPVLMSALGQGGEALQVFYVLGDATDERIDMAFAEPGAGDSVTADPDRYGDVMIMDHLNHRIEILHGSSRIPIHINPKLRAVPGQKVIDSAALRVEQVKPSKIVVEIASDRDEIAELTIYDLLGVPVTSANVQLREGLQVLPVLFDSPLSTGTYVIRLTSEHTNFSTRFIILR